MRLRSRAVRRLLAALAVPAMLAVGACSLLHDDYPDDSCRSDLDCFRAQGEVCDVEAQRCVPGPDAAPRSDAQAQPDAAPVDAGADT